MAPRFIVTDAGHRALRRFEAQKRCGKPGWVCGPECPEQKRRTWLVPAYQRKGNGIR